MPFHVDTSQESAARVTFELPADQHGSVVSVVGTFNDWTPGANELAHDETGTITTTVDVPYGQDIYFRYLSDDDGWFDDPEAQPAGDGSRIEPIARPIHLGDGPSQTPAAIDLSEPTEASESTASRPSRPAT